MGDRTAFFYGTLVGKFDEVLLRYLIMLQMAKEVLYRVCYGTSNVNESPAKAAMAANLVIKPALLLDHIRKRVKHADYPGMIAQDSANVKGTYVTGLTDGDIYRLDRFEGSQYKREKVQVLLLSSTAEEGVMNALEVEAETYIFLDDGDLEDGEWDFKQFVEEKMHTHGWADGGEEYVDTGMNDGTDPTGGRGFNSEVVDKLQEGVEDKEVQDVLEGAV